MTAIVIGAGANELVCAHYLARAGCRVLALPQHAAADDAVSDVGWIPPRLVRDLDLNAHGLNLLSCDPWAAAVLPGGGRLELSRDPVRTAAAIRRVSEKDAANWPAFCERMRLLARMLETLYLDAPPDPMSAGVGGLLRLAGAGLAVRMSGRQGVEDLLRLLPMPVADWLDDWFESDILKGMLGAAGIMHLQQGPRSGGTAFAMLHHHVGSPGGVFRPPLSNIRRVLNSLPGIEIRRGAEVVRISVHAGTVRGVVLAGGEEIPAALVISGADPRRTLLDFVDPGALDPELVRAVRHIRSRGVVARVTLMLERAPDFSTLVVAPSLDYLERAYDDAKYGHVSRFPYLEAIHNGQSTGNRHRVDVHMQYAPYALADGEWNDAGRTVLGERVVQILSQQLPELAAAVVERTVSTPRDLESALGWPEGQANHAELTLDQALWMRPMADWARYRTPIAGLYLCGPATHPASASGISGLHTASAVTRDFKSGRIK
jgi:phytoene dehydrogenase-like protein